MSDKADKRLMHIMNCFALLEKWDFEYEAKQTVCFTSLRLISTTCSTCNSDVKRDETLMWMCWNNSFCCFKCIFLKLAVPLLIPNSYQKHFLCCLWFSDKNERGFSKRWYFDIRRNFPLKVRRFRCLYSMQHRFCKYTLSRSISYNSGHKKLLILSR